MKNRRVCSVYHLICSVISIFFSYEAQAGLLFNNSKTDSKTASDESPTHPFSPEVIPPENIRGQEDDIKQLPENQAFSAKGGPLQADQLSRGISMNVALGQQESGLELSYNMPENLWLTYSATLHYDTRSWQDLTYQLYGPSVTGTLHYQFAAHWDPYLAFSGGFQHWSANGANKQNRQTSGGSVIAEAAYGIRLPLTANFALIGRQKYTFYPSGLSPEEETGKLSSTNTRSEIQILFNFTMTI